MTDLQECRKEIDIIDKEILRLFEKRMKVCENVAEYKIHTGKKVLDPKREQDKITVLKDSAHGEFNELGAQEDHGDQPEASVSASDKKWCRK